MAVKVQYPGIADAVRADMKNLGVLLRLARSITPELDTKAVGDEIRERIVEELDYELEASNQRTMARIYEGHPFIAVPAVVGSLCRERVIVSEFVTGRGFEELRTAPAAERDRIGEILFRFYFGSMYRYRRFSGDPHPGNMVALDDGRIAFLDFGLFKTISREVAELELACQRATIDGDETELHRLMSDAGFLPRPDRIDAAELMEFVRDGIWWYTTDEAIRIDSAIVNRAFIQTTDPRSTHYSTVRHQDIVPEHLFGRRLELLTLAVLGQLEAEANWYRIATEWIYGDEPATELGRAEAEWADAPGLTRSGARSQLRREPALDGVGESLEIQLGTELASDGGHPRRLHAAGDDPLERLQVVVDVDGQTVGGDAAAQMDADRADLPRLGVAAGQVDVAGGHRGPLRAGGADRHGWAARGPDAGQAVEDLRGDPVLGEGADHHALEQPDEGVDVGRAAARRAPRRRRSDRRPAGRGRGR